MINDFFVGQAHMLQSIRDNTHGWIAGVIISLLIFSFALWGIHSYFLGAGDNNVVAKVNGTQVTKGQLAAAYERLRRQLQIQFGTGQLPERAEAGLKERALQTLIHFQVLEQAALADDYRITSDQIDSFLQSMPEFQVNKAFSLSRFQQVLSAALFTVPDFIELIKTTLLIDQPRLGIILTSFAMPNEINDSIALISQERNVQYLRIPQNYFNQQIITITDENIHSYYLQHQDEFKTPEQVSIEYVLFSVKNLANKIHLSEDQLKNFYNENVNSFAQPAEWQLDEVILPVASNATAGEFKKVQDKMNEIIKASSEGKDFATLIKQYALVKGDAKWRNWVSINQIPVELQKTVATLTKPGQISEFIPTEKGLVLLKVIAYKASQAQPYDKVKDKVKEAATRQKAEEEFAEKREKIANLAYEHPDSLQVVAQELGMPIITTELFTRDKGGKDLAANTKIREVAFDNNVLNLQNNSDVIQLDPESAIVLRLKSHVPAAVLSLNSVRNQIEDKLRAVAIEDKLSGLANEIKNKLLTERSTPDQISSDYHLQWVNAGFIGRHATQMDQAILDSAFEMPIPRNGKKATYAVTKVANGFAVISLTAIKPGNIDVSKEQYQAFADQIQGSEGTLEYELYKDSLIRKSKIVMEPH